MKIDVNNDYGMYYTTGTGGDQLDEDLCEIVDANNYYE